MLSEENFKKERREWEAIYFAHISSKQKKNQFFLLSLVFQWFLYAGKKDETSYYTKKINGKSSFSVWKEIKVSCVYSNVRTLFQQSHVFGHETSCVSMHLLIFELYGILIISMSHIWEKLEKVKIWKRDIKCCTTREKHQLRFHQLLFWKQTISWSGFSIKKMLVPIWKHNKKEFFVVKWLIV